MYHSNSGSSDKRQTRGRSRGADDEIVLEGDSDEEDEKKKPSRLNKMPNPNAAAIKRRAEVMGNTLGGKETNENVFFCLYIDFLKNIQNENILVV